MSGDDLSTFDESMRTLWPKRVVKDGVTTEFFSPEEVIAAQKRLDEIRASKAGLNRFKRYVLRTKDPC